jgi:hypothetical protein
VTVETELTTTNPCPSWCQEPDGHPYTYGGIYDEPERFHRAEISGLEISALETMEISADGALIRDHGAEIRIDGTSDGAVIDVSVDDARRLIRELPDVVRLLSEERP